MTRLLITTLLLLTTTLSFAQKKEIAAAKDQVKSGKNLTQAENSLLKLLENPENQKNEKIYRLLNTAIQKQYAQLNEKLYLKQSVDSAAVFNTLNKAFTYAFRTYKAMPSEGKRNKDFLNRYAPNIYIGGMYFFKKEKYTEAFNLLDTYLTGKDCPLLQEAYSTNAAQEQILPAAFRALCSGYRLNDLNKTTKHRELALQYSPGNIISMKYLAEILQKTDSTYSQYIDILKDGFGKYPCDEYFFSRLLNHYLSNQRLQEGLDLCESAVKVCPEEAMYRYAKAHILLNMEKYEECITAAEETIAITDSIADCYYMAGIANVYLAEQYSQNAIKDKEARSKMLKRFEQAMPFLETYRQREPQRKDLWGSPLYNIYYNLNLGKKFDEISKELKTNN